MRVLFWAIALAVALVAAPAAAKGPATATRPAGQSPASADPSLAAPDPTLLRGVLPNGMRYAILPNRTPRQAVSIRLHVAAGSLVETEAERGAAHFVEHMAFQGSRRFPGTSAEARFAAAGMATGRDQNAFTDVNGALYVFDIPQVTDAKLALAFDWMRDAMDALSFDPAAAERERQVILQEIAVRRTGSTELGEVVGLLSAPNLLAARRSPGGTAASLAKIDAGVLKAFHDRWYRPERTTLVIAGDVDAAATLERLRAAFGDWRPAEPAAADPPPGRIDPARPLAALAVTTPNFAQGVVQVCKVAPRDPSQAPGVDAWKRDGAELIWLSALQTRLRRLARDPDAPMSSATATRTDAYRRAGFTCVSAPPKPGRWAEVLGLLSDEVRRMFAHGVTQSETDHVRTSLATALETAAAAADTRSSPGLAASLLNVMLDDRPFTTPAETARTFALAEPSLTAAAAGDAFRKRWASGGGPVVTVFSTTPVSTAQVLAAWAAAQATPEPKPLPEEAAVAWPYTDFGPPGRVVERRQETDPAFTRLRFANGVRVNFKRTSYARSRVDVRVTFGAGQEELRPDQQLAAAAAASTLGESGLGKLDAEDLERALQGKTWGASIGVGRYAFALSGGSRAGDLLTELQVLSAFLTDPGFRPQMELRLPTLADSYDKENRIEPLRVAQLAMAAALPQPHVFDPPTREAFAGLKVADFRSALGPALADAPLEVTVVGDIDEAAVVDALSRTLGALPARREGSRARPDAERARYPATAPPVIHATHGGLTDKAAVWVAWPLYVWTPQRQRETRALTLLREVMGEAMRKEIRERLGLTYTPSIGLNLDRGGDQGAMTVGVQTSPDKVDQVADAVRAVAARFARDGVSPEELERVRKPLLEDTARRTESNGWWMSTLDGSWAYPYKLEQQRTWLPDYTSIPASEVSAAARRWLAQAPLVATAVPAAKPASPPAVSPAAPPPVAAPPDPPSLPGARP